MKKCQLKKVPILYDSNNILIMLYHPGKYHYSGRGFCTKLCWEEMPGNDYAENNDYFGGMFFPLFPC